MCGRARYSTLASRKVARLTGGSAGAGGRSEAAAAPAAQQGAVNEAVPEERVGSEQCHDRTLENISPGMSVPVVIQQSDGSYAVESMKWGLIPHYAARDQKPDHFKIFNKRIESFSKSNKYFDQLAESKRCVVVFDGFYEWKGQTGSKQPYYVHIAGEPLIMPGIYEETSMVDNDGQPYTMRSFAVITGEPSQQFKEIHNRQPVMMNDQQLQRWLDPSQSGFEVLQELSNNAGDASFQADWPVQFHAVTKRMTNAKYQEEDCTKPIKLESDSMAQFLQKGKPADSSAKKRPTSPTAGTAQKKLK